MKFGNTIKLEESTPKDFAVDLCIENAKESCKSLGVEFFVEELKMSWSPTDIRWEYDAH